MAKASAQIREVGSWSTIRRTMVAACIPALLSCGGAPKSPNVVTSDSPMLPSPAPATVSFDLDDSAPARTLDLPDANINETPIHVWVQRDRAGTIGSLRVTGHANADVCREASLSLLQTLADRNAVTGFLGFGVGELRAGRDVGAYNQRITGVVKQLTALAASVPGMVQVHDVAVSQPDVDSTPPKNVAERTAYLRFRSPSAGPAYVPIRVWRGSGPATPLTFTVTAADLGVSAQLMEQLAPNIGAAPIVEYVNLLRDRIVRVDRLASFIADGGTLADHTMGYQVAEKVGSATTTQLAEYNELLVRFERYLDAMRFLSEGSGSEKVRQEEDARRAAAHRLTNELCIRAVRAGRPCRSHVRLTPKYPQTEAERRNVAALDSEMLKLSSVPPEDFRRLRSILDGRLADAKRSLDVARGGSTVHGKAAARETTIDGLLRGWPLPIPDDPKLERRLDIVQESLVGQAWDAIVNKIAATGVDVREPIRPGGVLNRSNVFFTVKTIGDDLYLVTPTYVVSGPYLEVWDPQRHTVTIETKAEATLNSLFKRAP